MFDMVRGVMYKEACVLTYVVGTDHKKSHLPVRTLLFQCSVCSHGGHQDCYRRFYMERPMVELPVPLVTRGRQLQREQDGENEGEEGRRVSESAGERRITGHPCAAGCGHFCWAAVAQRE